MTENRKIDPYEVLIIQLTCAREGWRGGCQHAPEREGGLNQLADAIDHLRTADLGPLLQDATKGVRAATQGGTDAHTRYHTLKAADRMVELAQSLLAEIDTALATAQELLATCLPVLNDEPTEPAA